MDELVTFLRAQLDEEFEQARVAAALTRSPWTSSGSTVTCADGFPVVSHGDGEAATAKHIARWDPARVLAEVEAKRKLIELYETTRQRQEANSARFVQLTKQPNLDQAEFTRVKTHGWELSGQLAALEVAVAVTAVVYADRPGYLEEWRPA